MTDLPPDRRMRWLELTGRFDHATMDFQRIRTLRLGESRQHEHPVSMAIRHRNCTVFGSLEGFVHRIIQH